MLTLALTRQIGYYTNRKFYQPMPEELKKKLKKQAREKGLKGKRADAYVYSTMRSTGWKPKSKKRKTTKRRKR